ncbi:hypothetical protein GOP47_0004109 [Adiantum capillus-veneris]|uniref:Oil body-associated protein 1A n=1 Tax=Adiantum capillus-veneris TaxID=13818 RepID=A0A9D4V6W6_ADICA|nr:hypothetical protein GOP47_0004109 [Adiantum capillus-veneris]
MSAVGPGPFFQSRDIPGEPIKTRTAAIEKSAEILQSFKPISKVHAHLCAFHFYAYDMRRQVEAHHYCTHLSEDVHQCLIYDTPNKDARLIGVEYIVTENVFLALPEEEKKFWHSHEYEVKSGVLFMPGVPSIAEKMEMKELAKTYGKVFHFWQFDKGDILPIGPPQLMMALTTDGQLDEKLAADVQARFNVSFDEKRKERADLEGPLNGVHPSANSWRKGMGLAPYVSEVDCVMTTPQEMSRESSEL